MVSSSPKEAEICEALLDISMQFGEMLTADDVLDGLHAVTRRADINVLGAVRLPDQFGDFDALVENTSVFLHSSVPRGWWEEYRSKSEDHPSPVYAMAQLCMRSFTTTESMRYLLPVGLDRWSVELSQQYGMRDSLACPIAGRWVLAYWTSDVLTSRLSERLRAMLFLAANYAVLRLESLIGEDAQQLNKAVELTPRELSVLYALSRGKRVSEASEELGIGVETVRTHIKKAQAKLDARTQTFAIAKAIRQRLIP
jgi:DNA-binding CsgD family transcriptional regulator